MSCDLVVQGFWRVTRSSLSAPISRCSLGVTLFTQHMHLQSDLTGDDCKSVPRNIFTFPSPSLPSITKEWVPMCEPAFLSVPSIMAVCSAEDIVYKGITTTYGQHSTLHMLFITLESPATCPSCSQGKVLALLLSSGPPNLSLCKQLHGRLQTLLRGEGSAKNLAKDEVIRKRLVEISWKRGQYRQS